jgi:hypothetical protein
MNVLFTKRKLLTFCNEVTPWSRAILDKLVKKFPAFYGSRRYVTKLICAWQLSIYFQVTFRSGDVMILQCYHCAKLKFHEHLKENATWVLALSMGFVLFPLLWTLSLSFLSNRRKSKCTTPEQEWYRRSVRWLFWVFFKKKKVCLLENIYERTEEFIKFSSFLCHPSVFF